MNDMNNYEIRFLKQSVLGQKTEMGNPLMVLRRCIELADRDMMSGGRFVCGFFNLKTSGERVNSMMNILKKANYSYIEIDKMEICNSIFWSPETTITVKGSKRCYKAYGLAQKLVNMTFKYLYIYRREIGQNIDFSECDCPLDSIIINDKLGRNEKWTNISEDEYNEIQADIGNRIEEDDKYRTMANEIGKMSFDDNWVNDSV